MTTTVTYKNEEIASLTNVTKTLETEGKYLEADIVLSDYTPQPTPLTPSVTVTASLSQQTITPTLTAGFQRVFVNPITSTLLASLDADFTAANIKKDVDMFGIVGTYEGNPPTVQSKTATPSLSSQTITPDSGYDGLSSVTVNPITSSLLASLDADFAAENIKKDVNMFGVVGTYEGGGGGGGSTIDILIVDQMGMIANVIYPPSATWTGFEPVGNYPQGTLTIPTNSMFILTTMGTAAFTVENVTATKITQAGKSISPLVYYIYVGTSDGLITTGGPLD